jgi:hypothetical protein
MVNWQVTATTVYCDGVGDEVTIMVYKDGQTKCTGYAKYGQPELRSKRRKTSCQGLDCSLVIGYRDKLFSEEAGRG